MDEVLRHLANNRVGDGSASLLRLAVDGGCQVLDVLRRVRRLNLHYPRGAAQVVVEGDTRGGVDEGEVKPVGILGGEGFHGAM